MIVALAGGVGGAKLAEGLSAVVSPGELTIVVNTADDFDLYGLRICPDLDTVLYTLAGLADPVHGWGIAGDTTAVLDAIGRLDALAWFRLGDRDFATHILRTDWLRTGVPLSDVVARFGTRLGVQTRLLPMSDDRVATSIETADGRLAFQDYFVQRGQTDEVVGVMFDGIEAARPAPGVLEAIDGAEMVVLCPSNPFVSVAPILAVPGVRTAVAASSATIVAVSPIVGGQAVKGPAAKMLGSLGHEVSALGVARLYAGLVAGFVVDEVDAALAPEIEALGMDVLVTETVMGDPAARRRLAADTLAFGRTLGPRRRAA